MGNFHIFHHIISSICAATDLTGADLRKIGRRENVHKTDKSGDDFCLDDRDTL